MRTAPDKPKRVCGRRTPETIITGRQENFEPPSPADTERMTRLDDSVARHKDALRLLSE
ncbi:MAG: hypothetical protein FWH44_01585 [Methanomassiliicoccaceae archaeon]|nr:hypothetical protein [Methanomassiliicoccaceae archaeon]